MRKSIIFIVVLLIPSLCFARMQIGMNVSNPVYFDSGPMFTDVMKSADDVRLYQLPSGPGVGTNRWEDEVSVDSNGYPLELPYNDGSNDHGALIYFSNCASGVHVVLVTGDGDEDNDGDADFTIGGISSSINENDNIEFTLTGDCSKNVWMIIDYSNSADPVTNIKIVPKAYEFDQLGMPTFTADFLGALSSFSPIRFMDSVGTNSSDTEDWSTRITTTYYSQGQNNQTIGSNGVSWDHLIDLCNTKNSDIWVNIPHKASNDYIDSLATLLLNNLNSGLKVYIEYSNEVWNSIFSQYKYILNNAPPHTDSTTVSGFSWVSENVYKKTGVTTEPSSVLYGDATTLSGFTQDNRNVYYKTGVTSEPVTVRYDSTFLDENNYETDEVTTNKWDWTSASGGTLWINVGENPSGGTVYTEADTSLSENDGATSGVGPNEWDWSSADGGTLWINVGEDPAGGTVYTGIRAELAAIGNFQNKKVAYMAKRVFDRFETIWSGQTNRLVRVAAGQKSVSSNIESMLDYLYDTLGGAADAVAITAYTGGITEAQHNIWNADPESVTAQDVVTFIYDNQISVEKTRAEAIKLLADERGIDVIAYEGGGGFAPYNSQSWDYNQAVWDAHILNPGSPSVYDLITQNMINHDQATVDMTVMVAFILFGRREVLSGSWGFLEDVGDYDDPDLINTAPKYKALLDYMKPATIKGIKAR